jgi:hypothetical protein
VKNLADMTEPELNELFIRVARKIEADLPAGPSAKGKCLFFLVVADETPGIGQYVGNLAREGAIKLLRETADRIERNQDLRRQ